MNSSEKKLAWKVFFLISPICVLLIMVLIHARNRPQNGAVQDLNVLEYWAGQTFTPITKDAPFRKALDQIPLNRKCSVTLEQEKQIRDSVYRMVMAFNGDEYEVYKSFRMPTSAFTFNAQRIGLMKSFCQTDWKNPSKEVPEDNEGIFKRFWEIQFLNKYVAEPEKVLKSTIGKSFWQGISLVTNNSEITIEESLRPPEAIQEILGKDRHTGGAAYPISIDFETTPETILHEGGKLFVATAKCLIQFTSPEPACPVYCRFYWDEKSKVWLPHSLALPIPGLTRTRELVF